jgi:hypothetical protein
MKMSVGLCVVSRSKDADWKKNPGGFPPGPPFSLRGLKKKNPFHHNFFFFGKRTKTYAPAQKEGDVGKVAHKKKKRKFVRDVP